MILQNTKTIDQQIWGPKNLKTTKKIQKKKIIKSLDFPHKLFSSLNSSS
jgi:hypothetical protein